MENILSPKKPLSYDCLIAVCETGHSFIINSTPSLFGEDLFDGCDLTENITTEKQDTIPKTVGVYKCKIFIKFNKCNHPQDPEEWEVTSWIEGAVKIKIK